MDGRFMLCWCNRCPALPQEPDSLLRLCSRENGQIFFATFCLLVALFFSFTYTHAMATCICIFGETAHVISPLQLSNGLAQVARRQKCKTPHLFFRFPQTLIHSRATAGCYHHAGTAGTGFVKSLLRPSPFMFTTTMGALLMLNGMCPPSSIAPSRLLTQPQGPTLCAGIITCHSTK